MACVSTTAATALHRDLAPEIFRQRLVVEGYPESSIASDQIVGYLVGLSSVTGMTVLTTPVTHRSDRYGWAGWIHWETSGAHFYAWDVPRLFFSVDIYTCKAFDPSDAIEFTRASFRATDIAARSF